jgi:phosphatidate cytidylyltransferase
MRNLLRRIFSGIVYILIFISSILFSKESYIILITIFGFLCIWEFSRMIKLKNYASYLIFGLLLFLMIQRQDSLAVTGILAITIGSSLFLIYQLFTKKEIKFSNERAKLGISIRYVLFSMCFLVLLPLRECDFHEGNFHPYLMISILSIIWVNDSFAFLIGKNFGKHKLFPSVSPKKTVEGFFGGLVFSLLAGLLISKYNVDFSMISWLVMAVIVSTIGTLGDLVESKFKRHAKVKDSGNIMPGHGGILDRLDSLLFAAPFVYLYINFII